jgi:shikimate dehydrogenase
MDQYAVIGNPIAQSKSPLIHGMFAQATRQDLEYGKIEGSDFAVDVDAFRTRGGRGLNITAPFKLDAFAYASEHSERAKLAGAVNCMKFDGQRVMAENFDGVGLVRDVVHNLKTPMTGKRVLMLGAGGAARGALLPFLAEKPAFLVIANRHLDKAEELAAIGSIASTGAVKASTYSGLDGQNFDIVFNATSASLKAELPPVPASVFVNCALAYELAYGKGLTPFLRLAHNAGVKKLADGVGMLAEQAAEAFDWWRGVRPDTSAVIKAITIPLV